MSSSQINQVILEGRLICQPALGIDDNGLHVGSLVVANLHQGRGTNFIASTRGELADVCASEFNAGEQIRVTGRLARNPSGWSIEADGVQLVPNAFASEEADRAARQHLIDAIESRRQSDGSVVVGDRRAELRAARERSSGDTSPLRNMPTAAAKRRDWVQLADERPEDMPVTLTAKTIFHLPFTEGISIALENGCDYSNRERRIIGEVLDAYSRATGAGLPFFGRCELTHVFTDVARFTFPPRTGHTE